MTTGYIETENRDGRVKFDLACLLNTLAPSLGQQTNTLPLFMAKYHPLLVSVRVNYRAASCNCLFLIVRIT